MQKRTSKGTSMNSAKAPAFVHSIKDCDSLLDYGCGRYPETTAKALVGKVNRYIPYDPYWHIGKLPDHQTELGVMSNVINVIDDDSAIIESIQIAKRHCKKLIITVYEGDKTGIGKPSKDDCWQCNRTIKQWAAFLLPHFPKMIRKGKMFILEQ